MRTVKISYSEWPLEGELFEIFKEAFKGISAKACWSAVKSAKMKYFSDAKEKTLQKQHFKIQGRG